jgi:hypothetical protein
MATCMVKTVEPVPPPKTYVLELSEKEAQRLLDVLGHCVERVGVDSISRALETAGLEDPWQTAIRDGAVVPRAAVSD